MYSLYIIYIFLESLIKTEDVVECKMDLSKGVGSLSCRMCSASYEMPIHHLHEPIDVFSEWLDDCEAAERGEVAAAASSSSSRRGGGGDMSRVVHDTSQDYDDDDDDEEDDLPPASGLGIKNKSLPVEEGNKKRKTSVAVTNLGLDDSDDDDSD
jgi:transcription elongation factor Elf1